MPLVHQADDLRFYRSGWSLCEPATGRDDGRELYNFGCTVIHMKTMIDLDDEALELAAKELGTTTKKDAVNAALEFVAGRRRRIEQLLDDPYTFGVGPDITNPDIMRAARR
jgi:Arc/MetJ family transcription regulator